MSVLGRNVLFPPIIYTNERGSTTNFSRNFRTIGKRTTYLSALQLYIYVPILSSTRIFSPYYGSSCVSTLQFVNHFVLLLSKMRTVILTSLLSAFVASANAYANPLSCSGTCTNAHDPALIRRDDGTYFRFSTGGKIAIHSSPSLTGPWTYRGAAIPNGSKIDKNGKNDLWVCQCRDARYVS